MPQPMSLGADMTDSLKLWHVTRRSRRFFSILSTMGITFLALGIATVFGAVNIVAGELAFVATNIIAIYLLVGKTFRHENEIRDKMQADREATRAFKG